MAAAQNPNQPSTSLDDSKFYRMGHTSGPYGNNPNLQTRGEFAEDPKDLRP